LGWRVTANGYTPIEPDERGWLWSEQLGMWLGSWHGIYLGEEHTWPRLYHPDGRLVLLPEEAARSDAEQQRQRAEQERQRAETLEARLAELEAELRRLRGA
jgi:hypothetical protein